MIDPIPDAAAFEAVQALIALITDAPACKARVLQLQKQADQLRDLQGKLAGEREAHDRRSSELDARQAKLDQDEAAVRQREVAVAIKENAEAQRVSENRYRHDREASRGAEAAIAASHSITHPAHLASRSELPQGTTITRAPYRDEPVKDAHYD